MAAAVSVPASSVSPRAPMRHHRSLASGSATGQSGGMWMRSRLMVGRIGSDILLPHQLRPGGRLAFQQRLVADFRTTEAGMPGHQEIMAADAEERVVDLRHGLRQPGTEIRDVLEGLPLA